MAISQRSIVPYDPASRGGNSPDGRKVKGTIHWVSCETAVPATIRLYENIVDEEAGVYNEDGSLNLNPNSLTVLENCYVEPSIAEAEAYDSFQFVRQGFFCVVQRILPRSIWYSTGSYL